MSSQSISSRSVDVVVIYVSVICGKFRLEKRKEFDQKFRITTFT